MDISGNNLLVSSDTGAGSGDAVRMFNASSESLTWRIGDASAGNDSTRRGNGAAFDPGYIAGGSPISAAAYLAIGSGRRHRLNTASGIYLNGQNVGAVINFPTTSTTWRDLDFDPATGDLYTRESNRVGKHTRTGDNAFSPNAILVALTQTSIVDSENIAFMDVSGSGNFLVFNDRSSAAVGQVFTSVIKMSDTAGTTETISWNFGAFGTPANGAGNYDFSWDAASGDLAVLDSNNRRLYIFAVPEPSAISLGALGSLLVAAWAARRRLG